MNRFLAAVGASIAALTPVCPIAAESPAVVRVDVSSFRNQKGTLRCGLYGAATFPDGEGVYSIVAVTGTVASCMFKNVGPGTYAIAVFHDENGNGKLDKNLFGVPSEGYGVSNNHTHAMSGPKWSEAKFAVARAEQKLLTVALRY